LAVLSFLSILQGIVVVMLLVLFGITSEVKVQRSRSSTYRYEADKKGGKGMWKENR